MNKKPTYEEMEKKVQELQNEAIERRRAEEVLKEKKESLKALMNATTATAVLVNIEGQILAINETTAGDFGKSVDELIGTALFDYFPADLGVSRKAKHEEVILSGKPLRFVDERVGRIYDNNIYPVFSPEGNVKALAIYARDVTEAKQVEQTLRENEEKYRLLFENTGTATFLVEEDTTIVKANAMCEEISGYSRDEIEGKMKTTDFIPVEELDRIEKYHFGRRAKDDQIPSEYEFSLLDRHGNKKNVFIQVSMLPGTKQSIASIVDITRLKKAEKALRESEMRYRELADSLPQVVFEMDTNGLITYTNRNGFDFFRYTRDDFDKGVSVFEMLIHEDREKARENINRRQNGEKLGSREYTALRKDGTTFPVVVHVNPIIRESETVGFRGIMIDITDRKQAEKEKEKLQAQLYQAQRMESIGTLAGGVAHDFNNLLMGILGRTSLMLNKADSTHPFYEHLKGIEDYVENATDLSKQLLGFARGGKYEVTPTDINDLVDKSARMFGRTKKEVRIHMKYQEGIWTVEVDVSQIEQVLLNLYINAWQSMPGGGDLYLQTENVRLDSNYIKPFIVDPGKYVKISVTDTGIGMEKNIQERIFEPFFTTKEMTRGTGMGLASAYGIIKKHKGFINVYSEKGEGTTFNIYLPVSDKEVLELEEKSHKIVKGTETILLVDDEAITIEVGKKLLEELGYRVLIARSGKEAVEVYRNRADEIDMVLLDMIMPGMSGGETFDKLKEMDQGIKVVLSSGYSVNGEAQQVLDRGCMGFIQKPFNLTAISQKTREILDKK
jgi:two-component system cell cycle sensor histidine kinase/response regulator CckA